MRTLRMLKKLLIIGEAKIGLFIASLISVISASFFVIAGIGLANDKPDIWYSCFIRENSKKGNCSMKNYFVKNIPILLCAILVFSCSTARAQVSEGDTIPSKKLKYGIYFEKKLEGEAGMTARAFDLKRNGGKNGIAVCGKKLYIFTARGTLLYNSDFDIFTEGAHLMRIAKFLKDGYYDNIVVASDSIKIFDKFGIESPTTLLNSYVFLNKDLNSDGIDEIITNGSALYTKDGGQNWASLWENRDTGYMQDMVDSENGGGFCYNQYLGPVFAVDRYGKILFQSKPGYGIRCLSVGDFDGDGIKDNIAVPDEAGTIYVYDKDGNIIRTIPINMDGEIVSLDQATSIEAGQLDLTSIKDDIVVGGRRGLVACNAEGEILWSYIKWGGWNSAPCIDNLFITDLNGDGTSEVVAGKGNEIFVFSNKGELLDELTVDGDLSKWKYPNSTMDIADVNNDCHQEIIAVTNEGKLYIFGLENK